MLAGGGEVDRDEQDYVIVLLSYDFMIGEMDEEADFMLTMVSIILSIIAAIVGPYLCYYGLLKPQCSNLKSKISKDD